MRNRASSIAQTTACWLAAMVLLLVPEMAWSQNQQDRGIGGTGVVSDGQDGDRGIGGTGVMGTIRGFGSIIVNGLRVTYAPDVPVRVDGQPRSASDLKIGQVVRVIAESRNGVLVTGKIDVASEVVGPIEATGGTTLRVLGQTVSTEKLNGTGQWRRGERVAVFGLRRPDGTIVASLLERRNAEPDRIAGRLVRLRDGSLRIGRLRLTGVDPTLVGTRVLIEGTYRAGVLEVTGATRERELLGPDVRQFSIEAYVEHTRNGLRLGSGLEVAGRARSALPVGASALAVVTAVPDRAGRLAIEQVQLKSPPSRPTGTHQGLDTRGAQGVSGRAPGRETSPSDRAPHSIQSPLDNSGPGAAHGSRGDSSNSGGAARGSGGGPRGGDDARGGTGRGDGGASDGGPAGSPGSGGSSGSGADSRGSDNRGGGGDRGGGGGAPGGGSDGRGADDGGSGDRGQP